jgi:hypothetical protein
MQAGSADNPTCTFLGNGNRRNKKTGNGHHQ